MASKTAGKGSIILIELPTPLSSVLILPLFRTLHSRNHGAEIITILAGTTGKKLSFSTAPRNCPFLLSMTLLAGMTASQRRVTTLAWRIGNAAQTPRSQVITWGPGNFSGRMAMLLQDPPPRPHPPSETLSGLLFNLMRACRFSATPSHHANGPGRR